MTSQAEHGLIETWGASRIEVGSDGRMAPPTLEDWLDAWLEERASMSVGTREKYRGHIDNHLAPSLGDLPIDAIQPVDVERLVHALLSRGMASGTVRRILGTLRSAYADAITAGVVAHDPTDGIDLPSAEGNPLVWSSAQVAHFLRSVRDDQLESLWRLILVHRLDRMEALDLRWGAVNLLDGVVDMRAVEMRRTIGGVAQNGIQGNHPALLISSDRFVTLDRETHACLREHRRQQAARRLRAGRDWFATDLVFTLPDGRPLNSWAVSRHFAELGQRAGLPPLGLNEARRRAALPERELVPRRR